MADLEQKKMQHIIGANLKKARNLANLSMQEVMIKIWNVDNNKNRLSELENGAKLPTLPILFELCELYGVSIDYIFGRTREPELDLQSQRAGSIMQAMRETGLELMDCISNALSKKVALMPKHESELLLDAAKKLIREHKKISRDSLSDEINLALGELEYTARQLDIQIARHLRTIELNCVEQINGIDSGMKNRLYTEKSKQLSIDISSLSIDDFGLNV